MIPENGRKLLICLVFGVVQQTLHKLVNALHHLGCEPFAKVYHHRCIEQGLLAERFQPNQILRIGILAQIGDCPFIRQVFLFLDVFRAKGDTRWNRRTT
jgi:hypothetical protein